MGDHSKPNTNGTDAYSSVLTYLKDRLDDVCCIFRTSKATAVSNPPDGTVRFNDSSKIFETYDLATTSWVALATKYGINVEQVDGYDVDVSAVAGKIPVRDSSGKVPGSITGDAATVATRQPGTGGGNLVYLESDGKIHADRLPSLSGNATTLSSKSLSLTNIADTIPVRGTGSNAGKVYAHVAGNIGSPNDTYGTGSVGASNDFLSLYGQCMGGGFGANSGIVRRTLPGSYTWTCPSGVNIIQLTAIGGGGGGGGGNNGYNNGSAGGPSSFGGYSAPGGAGGVASVSDPFGYTKNTAGGQNTTVAGVNGYDPAPPNPDASAVYGPPWEGTPGGNGGTGTFAGGGGGTYYGYVSVTPGVTYTIIVGAGGSGNGAGNGGNGSVVFTY